MGPEGFDRKNLQKLDTIKVVVPHQDLENPAFSQDGDDDNRALGDLPYACDVTLFARSSSFCWPNTGSGKAARSGEC